MGFLGELFEEELRKISNVLVIVFETNGNRREFCFDFDHVVEYKMCDGGQRTPSHRYLSILESLKDVRRPGIHEIGESHGKVDNGEETVHSARGKGGLRENGEENLKIGLADIGGGKHKFAESIGSGGL